MNHKAPYGSAIIMERSKTPSTPVSVTPRQSKILVSRFSGTTPRKVEEDRQKYSFRPQVRPASAPNNDRSRRILVSRSARSRIRHERPSSKASDDSE